MKESDAKRKQVSRAYGQAVTRPAPSGSCCSSAIPKGVAALLAGYSSQELSALPPEAVKNSFGCGNPLAFSGVKEGQTVLDLGSGAGIDILLAAKKVGPKGKAIGIDMTEEMLERARENIAAAGLSNVEVRRGIIEDLPLESNSVDWVISNCVINLSPEKPRVFREIVRVLKPGGRISISDIVAGDLPEKLRKSEWLYNTCIAGAISESEYVAGLQAAGLVEVEVRERLRYDDTQLPAFAESEGSCCGGPDPLIKEVLAAMSGQVWSAKFSARKPG